MHGWSKMQWNDYQENITILGMQGSGKTTLAKSFLNQIPNRPRLIISPQIPLELYGQYGNPISSIDELKNNGAFVWTDYNYADLQELINKISKKIMTFKNFLLVVDDSHEFCSKQKMPNEWKRLINSGRNRGIVSIMLSPSPNLLHNVILQSSQHLISFKFVLESQVEYARKNFFGDVGFLLLPQKVRPEIYRKFDQMRPHEFLYRSINETHVKFYFENQEYIELTSIDEFTRNIEPGAEADTAQEPETQGPEKEQEPGDEPEKDQDENKEPGDEIA